MQPQRRSSHPCLPEQTPHTLWQAVSAVYNNIRTSSVARSIASQVQESTLQLTCLALATHWSLISPDVLSLLGDKVRDFSRDVAWRNGVGSSKANPLDSQRFTWDMLV